MTKKLVWLATIELPIEAETREKAWKKAQKLVDSYFKHPGNVRSVSSKPDPVWLGKGN